MDFQFTAAQRELRDRVQTERVVDQAGGEHDGAADENAEHLLVRSGDRTERERAAHAGREAGEDADAAEVRRRLRVPAVLARRRHQAPGRRRAEEEEQDERSDRVCDE